MPTRLQFSKITSMSNFAKFFTEKNLDGIASLLTEDFSLYDPALEWVHGKEAVVDIFHSQFEQTDHVEYNVINLYEDGNNGIMEFKIILDEITLYGVDFIKFDNGKMKELRCYYNPPKSAEKELQPFSSLAQSLVPGDIYEHYKGVQYQLISVARHSETLEEVVVYKALYGDGDTWIRPLKMFTETVHINGDELPRFKNITGENG